MKSVDIDAIHFKYAYDFSKALFSTSAMAWEEKYCKE